MEAALSNPEQNEFADYRARRLMAMGQMAASLAHEIRNPLGSMELFCTLLKKDLRDQPQLFEHAEQIHLGIRRLDQIISNCLQFARDIRPKQKRIEDPKAYLAEIAAEFDARAKMSHATCAVESDGTPIEADPILLRQVLGNLIANALDAVSEQEQVRGAEYQPRVTIRSQAVADEVVLTVQDNGGGIPEDLRQQIFDPFFTTKNRGTGLGLAIVHAIVSAHGGRLELSSTQEGGTTLSIRLPKTGSEQ